MYAPSKEVVNKNITTVHYDIPKINTWRQEGRTGPEDFTKAQLSSAYEWVKSAIGTRSLPNPKSIPITECYGMGRVGKAFIQSSTISTISARGVALPGDRQTILTRANSSSKHFRISRTR